MQENADAMAILCLRRSERGIDRNDDNPYILFRSLALFASNQVRNLPGPPGAKRDQASPAFPGKGRGGPGRLQEL